MGEGNVDVNRIISSYIVLYIECYCIWCHFNTQLAPPDSPMRLSWETFVGKDPIHNLPSNNDDALASVLKGNAEVYNVNNHPFSITFT